jgi:DNA-binding MarR family transcriptional regulator
MSPLEHVVKTFQRWLHLPHTDPLLAVLAAVAANLLTGDPVWLLLVGPPGSGKSELLQSLGALPNVHPAATLTEAALLSGTPKKEHSTGAKGGLLREIGDFGIIIAKDFGSVLSMNRDGRAALLAALREVYDGSWTRHVGTDGGRTLPWAGKVGLVAGVTPTIDRHHAVMGSMGERFILFRLPEVDENEQAARALAHVGKETSMRRELSESVALLFSAGLGEPRELTDEDRRRLIALATLTVRCRSSVERDGYTREIELIPDAEAPTRLVVVLAQLLAGLDAIGATRQDAWRVVTKASLDSIPATRRSVMEVLLEATKPIATPKLAERLGYPTPTAKRALEDLTAHRIARRASRGTGQTADTWEITERTRQRHQAISASDMSSNTRSGRLKDFPPPDISDAQDAAWLEELGRAEQARLEEKVL